jgi:hypothetical protein
VFCGVVADAAVAAFGSEAVVCGDGFEESRFAGSVFSGKGSELDSFSIPAGARS